MPAMQVRIWDYHSSPSPLYYGLGCVEQPMPQVQYRSRWWHNVSGWEWLNL